MEVLPGANQDRGVEDDLHWNALNHFDIIAGRVLRRQETESVAAARLDAVDAPWEIAAISVDLDGDGLSGAHVGKLRLLIIGCHP